MNAPTKIEAPANLALWDALGKTDPVHTKRFKRAGGFEGTAVKPIWTERRLTEHFGPCGIGWGMDKPEFQLVNGENRELLVYCTIRAWHGSPENSLWGVGGDKVITYVKANEQYKRPERWDNDDEAFKKAKTDALHNAFKHIGCGADVHMGRFDDSKYVREVAAEFAEGHSQNGAVSPPQPRQPAHSALKTRIREFVHELNGCGDGDQISAFLATAESVKLVNETREKLPHLWDGSDWPENLERPEEFVPLADLITKRQHECAQQTAALART